MKNEDELLNCWNRLWNKVNRDCTFIRCPDAPKKFDFIENIINGDKVDTSKYSHLELIRFIDDITRSIAIAKRDWPLITRIVNCINICYQDTIHTYDIEELAKDIPNTPKEAQKVLLEVLRSIFESSDSIREYIFGTSNYYTILRLDPNDIVTKYNNYIKSTGYRIGDEIYTTIDPDMRAWITKIERYDFDCLLDDGSTRCFAKAICKKTGRHNVSLGAILHDNMEGCIIMEEDKKL